MNTLVKHFAVVAFLLLSNTVERVNNHLLTWSEYTSLQWDDFAGEVDDSSHFEAECFTEIRYSYKNLGLNNIQFNVTAYFDKNASWIKPESKSESLLRHEQVHFDIAQIYACKLQQAFDNYTFTSNFSCEIAHIFDTINKEYLDTQKLYDEQSDHSLDKTQQRNWEVLIHSELENVNLQSITLVK